MVGQRAVSDLTDYVILEYDFSTTVSEQLSICMGLSQTGQDKLILRGQLP